MHDLGRTPADVRAVLLTHAHFDHVGSARRCGALRRTGLGRGRAGGMRSGHIPRRRTGGAAAGGGRWPRGSAGRRAGGPGSLRPGSRFGTLARRWTRCPVRRWLRRTR
ncbi:MBL fold metallo-hydrolase [Nocardia carnea]|uniref:MBL fold metallo-hydrolase n=1 Tax=Nocardia carnea TaxID=37328 RepID=UPI002456995F|nr:MBL fold metallo-hydrolase [Nocardia carnea]